MGRERIEQEKDTVYCMIRIYCNAHHKGMKQDEGLCQSCNKLAEYARKRLELCKFGNKKKACKKCSIHCYSRDMREQIKVIMRYAGPRMIWKKPLATLRHFL